MYEASFGLKRRPFAATPDATCFLASGPIQAALDELVVCVEHGQGIAVLTAPAGTGKTLLCERLRFELDDRYECVFLRHASFLTRRALLQTVLCELNSPYHHPSEQELRLELFPAIRALQPKREALVLICDEAHQLTDSLLEELRILADFAESGRPLVRLVLVGQLGLEEKLAQPSLEAFNQRIRAHVNLSTFDLAGSLDYIDYRITWAGGRTNEVFTPDALDMIAKASDGVPRCVNQLADHTLLLAFVAEQRPAGAELVREALNDLRQLPLHWNEPSQSLSHEHAYQTHDDEDTPKLSGTSNRDSSGYLLQSPPSGAAYSYEPEFESESPSHRSDLVESFEVGASAPQVVTHDALAFETIPSKNLDPADVGGDDWRKTLDLFDPHSPESRLVDTLTDLVSETSSAASFSHDVAIDIRRNQFDELLHDAYSAAGTSISGEQTSEPTVDIQVAENLNTFQIPWSLSGYHGDQFTAAQSQPIGTTSAKLFVPQKTNEFHEEVILDRYASIDAGLEPPAMPVTDTSCVEEVRAERLSINPVSYDVTTGIHNIPTHEFDLTPFTDQSKKNSRSGDSSSVTNQAFDHDAIDRIAQDVYSLAQIVQSPGMMNSKSESILKSFHHEVDGPTEAFETQSDAQHIESTDSANWESVETPVVPQPVESRPFRFLFSQLRRKQHGLS